MNRQKYSSIAISIAIAVVVAGITVIVGSAARRRADSGG